VAEPVVRSQASSLILIPIARLCSLSSAQRVMTAGTSEQVVMFYANELSSGARKMIHEVRP